MDEEEAAGKRALALEKLPKEPVDFNDYQDVIDSGEREHWEQISHPQNFDWYLIRRVPLKFFPEATLETVKQLDDPEERKEHRDRINEILTLLKAGEPVWPVIVASESGVIVDGWHRLAALHKLKVPFVDILYA